MKRLLNAPRLIRILWVGLVALAVVLALFALVDRIYIYYFFTWDTVIVPSLVSMSIGLGMYIWGWFLFVGTRGVQLSYHRLMPIYMTIALLAILTDVILLVQGFSMTDYIAG